MIESPEISRELLESLKSLGLTKYEALVYIALLRVEGATATEIHEISGVPRASVYPVLDRLIQKNLVSVSNTAPKRFNASPPEKGISSLLEYLEKNAEYARDVLQELYRHRIPHEHGQQELIWTILGEENINRRIRELLSHADESIKIIGTWYFLERELLADIKSLDGKLPIEIVSDQWELERAFQTVSVTILSGHEKFGRKEIAGVFIIDESHVMVVMGSVDSTPTALYSESPGFVTFFQRYWSMMRNFDRIAGQ